MMIESVWKNLTGLQKAGVGVTQYFWQYSVYTVLSVNEYTPFEK